MSFRHIQLVHHALGLVFRARLRPCDILDFIEIVQIVFPMSQFFQRKHLRQHFRGDQSIRLPQEFELLALYLIVDPVIDRRVRRKVELHQQVLVILPQPHHFSGMV